MKHVHEFYARRARASVIVCNCGAFRFTPLGLRRGGGPIVEIPITKEDRP